MHVKHWQVWGKNQPFRKPVPVFYHFLGKEMFPYIQSEPPLVQLWGIPTCPLTGSQGEGVSMSLTWSCKEQWGHPSQVTPSSPVPSFVSLFKVFLSDVSGLPPGWLFSDLEHLDPKPKHSQAMTTLPKCQSSTLLLLLPYQLVGLKSNCTTIVGPHTDGLGLYR